MEPASQVERSLSSAYCLISSASVIAHCVILLARLQTSEATEAVSCPQDTFPAGAVCVWQHMLPDATYAEAQQACEEGRGILVVMNSAQQEANVNAALEPRGARWIGLSRLSADSDFVWSDGSAMTYGSFSSGTADCASRRDTGWSRASCHNRLGYICQKPALTDSDSSDAPTSGSSDDLSTHDPTSGSATASASRFLLTTSAARLSSSLAEVNKPDMMSCARHCLSNNYGAFNTKPENPHLHGSSDVICQPVDDVTGSETISDADWSVYTLQVDGA